METIIYSFLERLNLDSVLHILANTAYSPKLDLSIEGMRSQQFSAGVFFFMLLGVLVFSGIVYMVMFGNHAPKTMRSGEKVMFALIILGIIVAVIFGGLQMLGGYLY
ncbi:hypothetical protein [Candidatus Nitrotoga arctica]|uniref:Uncharacterized protein n=1 Tax=Candidatus Nitrotoga arctica TaxID=453162 RepID=A0ABN8AV37_9PROT|nr:hypothetical protein [Candidatus Nitrotoga arctica]CAG9934333.1 conserved protein of unknown function [Candidatus Nitrotoga arctica]